MMAALGILDEMAEADAAINDVLTSMITISEEDETAPTPGMDRRVSTQSTETADSEPDDDLEDGLKPAMMKRKIAASVRRGQVNKDTALVAVQWVDNEVRKLAKFIQDHGTVRDLLARFHPFRCVGLFRALSIAVSSPNHLLNLGDFVTFWRFCGSGHGPRRQDANRVRDAG